MFNNTITLSKGVVVPQLALGTWLEFVISDEDMEVLKNVEHIKDYGEHGFFPVFGGKM